MARRSKRLAEHSVDEVQEDATAEQDAAMEDGGAMEADISTGYIVPGDELRTVDEEAMDDSAAEGEGTDAEQLSDEEPELDVFEEDARAAVDALQEAVAEPAAFLRPSASISELARHAAKVNRQLATSP